MANCELCGEPMPSGEEMFKFHGYSGPCPKPPLPDPALATGAENYHTVFNDRRDLDDDLPDDVRRELMQAAVANGSISYHWLSAVYRRGLRDGGAATARAAALVVEKHADEVLALRLERDALNKTRAEIWENPEQWMKWCDLRVLKRAEAAEQALTEKEQPTLDLDRLAQQALAISLILADAGVNACPLPEGVQALVRRVEAAEQAGVLLEQIVAAYDRYRGKGVLSSPGRVSAHGGVD